MCDVSCVVCTWDVEYEEKINYQWKLSLPYHTIDQQIKGVLDGYLRFRIVINYKEEIGGKSIYLDLPSVKRAYVGLFTMKFYLESIQGKFKQMNRELIRPSFLSKEDNIIPEVKEAECNRHTILDVDWCLKNKDMICQLCFFE